MATIFDTLVDTIIT